MKADWVYNHPSPTLRKVLVGLHREYGRELWAASWLCVGATADLEYWRRFICTTASLRAVRKCLELSGQAEALDRLKHYSAIGSATCGALESYLDPLHDQLRRDVQDHGGLIDSTAECVWAALVQLRELSTSTAEHNVDLTLCTFYWQAKIERQNLEGELRFDLLQRLATEMLDFAQF